jgi:hypothetical protein
MHSIVADQNDFLPAIATTHDMVNRPWILDAHLPWHDASLPAEQAASSQINRGRGLTLFTTALDITSL